MILPVPNRLFLLFFLNVCLDGVTAAGGVTFLGTKVPPCENNFKYKDKIKSIKGILILLVLSVREHTTIRD